MGAELVVDPSLESTNSDRLSRSGRSLAYASSGRKMLGGGSSDGTRDEWRSVKRVFVFGDADDCDSNALCRSW